MLLFLLLAAGAAAGEEGQWMTGYFEKAKYLRPDMKASGKALETLPAYMQVTFRKVNEKWGEVTLENGETAYLAYSGIRSVPETESVNPYPAFCLDSYYVRSLPFSKSPRIDQVESFEEVTVTGVSRDFSRVRTLGGKEGFILTERLRKTDQSPEKQKLVSFLTNEYRRTLRLMNSLTEVEIPPEITRTGTIRRHPVLDSALSMLEADNPFLLRYNAITGADIRPLFPLGVPYFWGGRDFAQMTERLPDYTTRKIWDGSNAHYVRGTSYLYGLDCTGLVEVAYAQAGTPLQTELSELSLKKHCEEHTGARWHAAWKSGTCCGCATAGRMS